MVKKGYRGGRFEYRAIVAKSIEPKELGLAGALQIARVDRQIGAKGQLHKTWLVASRSSQELSEAEWLRLEQQWLAPQHGVVALVLGAWMASALSRRGQRGEKR